MKRLKPLIALLIAGFVLLCGCNGGNPTNQKMFENDSAQAVWDEYHNRIAEAASSDNLSYIKIVDADDIIITDKKMIKRWLTALKENKPADIAKYDSIIGERPVNLTFGYSDKEVALGSFHSMQINVYYSDKWDEKGHKVPEEYCLEIPYENGTKIRELAIECGFDPLLNPN